MKSIEKGRPEKLRKKKHENLQCHVELKERLALSGRFLVMTSDLEKFPDGFFSPQFIYFPDEYSKNTDVSLAEQKALLCFCFFESITSQKSCRSWLHDENCPCRSPGSSM